MKRKILAVTAAICWAGAAEPQTAAQAQVFTRPKSEAPASRPQPRPNPATPRTRPSRAKPSQRAAPTRTYADPVAYCAVHRDRDAPDAAYVGEPAPNWISAVFAPSVSDDLGAPGATVFNWRCMGGRVVACAASPTQTCSKPSQDKNPAPDVLAYCSANPSAELPPDLVENSVAAWVCRDGAPVISGFRSGLDPRGYFADRWRDVTDYAPANMVGAVSRAFVGDWRASAQGGSILRFQYDIQLRIDGGTPGNRIGHAAYYQLNSRDGRPIRLCETDLLLAGRNPSALEVAEQFTFKSPNIACPVQGPLLVQMRDGQLWLEWRRKNNNRVTLSAWAQRR